MTRGKHANAAEARRVRETAVAESTRLRRELEAARTENLKLSVDLLESHTTYTEKVRDLQLLIAANTSRELQEMEANFETAKKTIEGERETNKKLLKQHEKAVNKIIDHLVEEHHWTGHDATQWLLTSLGSDAYITDDPAIRKNLTPDQAYRLDVVRGYRKSGIAPTGTEKTTATAEYPT